MLNLVGGGSEQLQGSQWLIAFQSAVNSLDVLISKRYQIFWQDMYVAEVSRNKYIVNDYLILIHLTDVTFTITIFNNHLA